jgi:hypothetical protein
MIQQMQQLIILKPLKQRKMVMQMIKFGIFMQQDKLLLKNQKLMDLIMLII